MKEYKMFLLKCSTEDKETMKNYAKKLGLNYSAYIRLAALTSDTKLPNLKSIVNESTQNIYRSGLKMNDLAYKSNLGIHQKNEIENVLDELLMELKKLNNEIGEINNDYNE